MLSLPAAALGQTDSLTLDWRSLRNMRWVDLDTTAYLLGTDGPYVTYYLVSHHQVLVPRQRDYQRRYGERWILAHESQVTMPRLFWGTGFTGNNLNLLYGAQATWRAMPGIDVVADVRSDGLGHQLGLQALSDFVIAGYHHLGRYPAGVMPSLTFGPFVRASHVGGLPQAYYNPVSMGVSAGAGVRYRGKRSPWEAHVTLGLDLVTGLRTVDLHRGRPYLALRVLVPTKHRASGYTPVSGYQVYKE